MPGQLAAGGSRAVADLGGHRAGQPGHLGERHRGQVPPLPGQLDHAVPLGRTVSAYPARLPLTDRVAVAAPRLARGGAKFPGQPVPFLSQPGTVGFQGGDPRGGVLTDLSDQAVGILAGLRKLGSHAACLPFGPGAHLIPLAGSIGQSLGDGLAGVGPDPVQLGADFGLGGARPFRLTTGLLRLGGGVLDGLIPLADRQGDLFIGCPPDRFN